MRHQKKGEKTEMFKPFYQMIPVLSDIMETSAGLEELDTGEPTVIIDEDDPNNPDDPGSGG